MLTLSSDLTDAQQARHRKPVLAVSASRTRFGVPLALFAAGTTWSGTDAPMVAATGSYHAIEFTIFARNNAGSIQLAIDPGGSWSTIDTATAGQGIGITFEPVSGQWTIAYGDGNDLKLYTIDGASSTTGPTTLVTEASAIGAVAIAAKSTGDLCAFYALGTTTTVKRLRRTAGTWAGSGTTWSKTGSVASITGLSAVHSGNFYLAVTGTEVTTTHERLWSVAMGDGPLPANAWSGLVPIAEADAAAALTFHHPNLCYVDTALFCSFQQTEAGDVAADRVMLTHTTSAGDPLAYWREPFPPGPSESTFGAPVVRLTDPTSLVAVFDTNTYYFAALPDPVDLSSSVLSASWRETPDSLRVRVEIALDAWSSSIVPGMDLALQHGLTIADGTTEYGVQLLANIQRVSRRIAEGKATILVEADGPWEALARYHAPAAWTAPSATTRGQIFARIAARAGVTVNEAAGDFAPSTAWTTDTPLFAIGVNESGRSVLLRLLAPTPDFLRLSSSGGFEVVNGEGGTDEAAFSLRQNPGELALITVTTAAAARPAWSRLQAEDRYADAFAYGEPEANFHLVRDFSVSGDAATEAAAAAALLRSRLTAEAGQLLAPVHVGLELFDLVEVGIVDHDDTLTNVTYRAVARGVDFKRGPAGGPAYNSVITLGEID